MRQGKPNANRQDGNPFLVHITTYIQLNEAALLRKQSKVLAFWYILRHLCGDKPCLPYAKAQAQYCTLTGKTPETFRTTLAEAVATHLVGHNRHANLVSHRSPAHLAELWQIDGKLDKVEVPLENLTGGIGKRRVTLYATMHTYRRGIAKPKESKPRSRAFIKERTGLHKSTQLHYENTIGVSVKANYSITASDGRSQPTPYNQDSVNYDPSIVGLRQYNGKWYWLHQIPNSYNSPFNLCGKKRTFRSQTRSAKGVDFHRYYTIPQAIAKAIEKGKPNVYGRDNTYQGGNLWILESY